MLQRRRAPSPSLEQDFAAPEATHQPAPLALAPHTAGAMQASFGNAFVARAAESGGGDDGDTGRYANPGDAFRRAAAGGGAPLPPDARSKFEGSLGADLSGVRLHTGPGATESADALGAKAFAVGQDIHFNAGRYDPGGAEGERLLAHEVAHTVQQGGGGGGAQAKLEVSSPGDGAEVEADRAADAMVAGRPFQVGAAPTALARDENKDKKEGEEEPKKKKYPSWKDDTLSLPLGESYPNSKFDIKLGEPPSGTLSVAGSASHNFIDISHTWNPPLAPGLMADVSASAKGGITASAQGSVSGAWAKAPGPRVDEERMLNVTAKGGGKVSANLSGTVKVGAAVGAPYFALAGGGALTLSAVGEIGATLGGGFSRFPSGDYSGSITFTVDGTAKIEGTGSIYFDAILANDRYNISTFTIGKHTFGELTVKCPTVIDPATGSASGKPTTVAKWYGFPSAQKVCTRKLTEEERLQYLPVNQGASGAPPSIENLPREIEVACPAPPAPAQEPAPEPSTGPWYDTEDPEMCYADDPSSGATSYYDDRDPNMCYADDPGPVATYYDTGAPEVCEAE